ncbi:FtsX-like permease family protein [Candidatus Dependentiae bacterium]|nr:FtsX-like permease family protein [Candidatus Dependentiae bacterium]
MILPISFLLQYAYRLTLGALRTASIAPVAYIAGGSIFVAACSLTLICAIMQGFHTATIQQLRTIWPAIMIDGAGQELNIPAINTVLQQIPHITAYAPQARQPVPIIVDGAIERIGMIIAIDPEQEELVSRLLHHRAIGNQTIGQALQRHQVIIGSTLAEDVDYQQGDAIKIGIIDEQQGGSLALKKIALPLRGTLHTGIEEIDTSLIVMSLATYEDLFDRRPTIVAVAVDHEQQVAPVMQQLRQQIPGIALYSFAERNPAILAALHLEQLVMTLLIGLMALIASTTLIALLFMVLTANNRQLLILSLHGLSARHCSILTSTIALFITIPATITGVATGYTMAWLLRDIFPLRLPPLYYVEFLPIELTYSYGLLIIIAALGIALFAGFWVSYKRATNAILHELC